MDRFGRVHNNLRISVTDRCNFRCRYCMPAEGVKWLDRRELLTFEEITRLVHIFSRLGITKVRLTGGEPLLRKELDILVSHIARVPGIHDLAMTTNGYFLADSAQLLANAGLKRITVSMDSLDPKKFSEMARRDYLRKVQEGLEAVEALRRPEDGRPAIRPVKVNVVVIRGVNDDEIEDFARLARSRPLIVRFIEFMPIGADDGWLIEKVVPSKEILGRINATGHRLIPVGAHGDEPASRFRFDDGAGEIGFISSVTEPFCKDCNRIRITSDGKLRTCLFALEETDLRSLVRGDANDEEIARVIADAVREKGEGHLINRPGFVRPERTMSQIGG